MDERSLFSGLRTMLFREIQNSHPKGIKFNSLKKSLNLESNDIAYHLKILLKSGLIEKTESKDGSFYKLSHKGKIVYPYIPIITNEQKPVFVIACGALINSDTIYFQEKPREPEKGSLILFGGKVLSGKSIEETVINYIKEQANCDIKELKLKCVNEFMKKDARSNFEFHNIVYFYTAVPVSKPYNKTNKIIEKKISELKDDELFWDNKFFIREMLNNKEPKVTKTIL